MEINSVFIRSVSILTFIYIIRLIYSHKLRIGHSWFLFLLGMGFLILSVWPGTIRWVTLITGAHSWLNNILFFLVAFLFMIVVHCSLMISALTTRVKELGQQLALLSSEIDGYPETADPSGPGNQTDVTAERNRITAPKHRRLSSWSFS